MALPDFDNMTPNQVREWGEKLTDHARQLDEIRATLIVNCEPGRRLHNHGIDYDPFKSVLHNLCHILESLSPDKP
jgi:hypothetical protein